MSDDKVGRACQRGDSVIVELLTAQLVIGDAGEPDHLFV
jgi:hypothetical protein